MTGSVTVPQVTAYSRMSSPKGTEDPLHRASTPSAAAALTDRNSVAASVTSSLPTSWCVEQG